MMVAKELGMSLTRLRQEMTPQELWLWMLFFDFQGAQQQEAMKKAKSRRR
jgi:prephenate dehydratase